MISKEEASQMGRDDMLRKLPGPPTTSQNFSDSLDGIEHMSNLLVEQKLQVKEQWIKDKCPFKIGETLTGNDYSFEGRQFVVEEIMVTEGYTSAVDYKWKWKWVAVGHILNKDGTVGKNYTKHSIAVADVKGY